MNDVQANIYIEEIKELENDIERLDSVCKKRIEMLQNETMKKITEIKHSIRFKKDELRAFLTTVKTKDTKTMKKYTLPSGELRVKKSKTTLVHDDKQILIWAEHHAKDLIKETIAKKLDWANLKNDIEIQGDTLVRKSTGEIIECAGLGVIDTNEELEIKF